MPAPTERHETRALLRAHLAAASGYRHLTRHCPICHRLLRLAMEPLTAPQAPRTPVEPGNSTEAARAPETGAGDPAADAGAAPLPLRRPAGDGATGTDCRAGRPETLLEARPEARPGDESPPAT
ncbi:DUF6274 family protein [Streptomyces sp. NPDC057287]|uniref:DUF6274 family protein n=1 Tax=Streptomyces sp. NPDC057287 TaxID=3346086 RepID=UPI003640A1AD